MFENLLGFWKGKDFLTATLEDFNRMLGDTHTMFISAFGSLFETRDVLNLKEDIYKLDRRVNELEKNIRKRVVEHLSIRPTVDTSACLILMSVVKDAERIGDFAKNLFEIRSLLKGLLNKDTYKRFFNDIDDDIKNLFYMTKEAFIDSDGQKAKATWEYQRKIKSKCKDVISRVVKSNLEVPEAVCFALMARYFIRISSHLTNIATSVILPLDNLDYFDEELQ